MAAVQRRQAESSSVELELRCWAKTSAAPRQAELGLEPCGSSAVEPDWTSAAQQGAQNSEGSPREVGSQVFAPVRSAKWGAVRAVLAKPAARVTAERKQAWELLRALAEPAGSTHREPARDCLQRSEQRNASP